jgi:hypothetical protein
MGVTRRAVIGSTTGLLIGGSLPSGPSTPATDITAKLERFLIDFRGFQPATQERAITDFWAMAEQDADDPAAHAVYSDLAIHLEALAGQQGGRRMA